MIKFANKRKTKMVKLSFFFSILLIIGLFTGQLFLSFSQNEFVKWTAPAFLILLMLSSFSVTGYLLNISRLFIYGIMITFLGTIGEILFWRSIVTHHGYPLVFGIPCGTMIITGIILLIHFVKKYPLEVADGETKFGQR